MSANRPILCENSGDVHISPHNSGPVIDSEKSSITGNRKLTMGLPTSHHPRLCITPNFPQMSSDTQISRFLINFDKTFLKICYKVPLTKSFQQQTCSAFNCLSNGIKNLLGDDPVPVKFWPKVTEPQ